MTKNTIMPIERAFDEYLEYCEFTRRMSRQTLSAKRWVMRDFRASVPAKTLGEISQQSERNYDAAGERLDYRAGTARSE